MAATVEAQPRTDLGIRTLIAGDGVRGVGALFVFATHVCLLADPIANNNLLSYGWAAPILGHIDLALSAFFVLSGYLIARPFTRAYVTCTEVHLEEPALERAARALGAHVPEALPEGAAPLGLIQLTSHRGHFLGRAHSHLLLYRDGGADYIRDVGCWDRLPPHLSAAYAAAGRDAQHAFWGPEPAERSMLAQLARGSSRGS